MVGQTDFYERFASVTEWRAGSVALGCNRLTRRYVEIGKPRVCVLVLGAMEKRIVMDGGAGKNWTWILQMQIKMLTNGGAVNDLVH